MPAPPLPVPPARRLAAATPLVGAALLMGCPMIGFSQPETLPREPPPGPPQYACQAPNGLPCEPPRARMTLDGWRLTRVDAHDGVIAFLGQRWSTAHNGLDSALHVGRASPEGGPLAWSTRLGSTTQDTSYSDLRVADGGDIVVTFVRGGSPNKAFVVRYLPDGRLRHFTELRASDDGEDPANASEFAGASLQLGKYTYVTTSTSRHSKDSKARLFALAPDGEVVWQRILEPHPTDPAPPAVEGSGGGIWMTFAGHEIRHYSAEGSLDYRAEGPPMSYPRNPVPLDGTRAVLSTERQTVLFPTSHQQSTWSDFLYLLEPGKDPVAILDTPRCSDCYQGSLYPWPRGELWFVESADHGGKSELSLRPVDARGVSEPFRVRPYTSHYALPGERELLYVRMFERGSEIIVQPLESQAARPIP